jgi:hypothetical protein
MILMKVRKVMETMKVMKLLQEIIQQVEIEFYNLVRGKDHLKIIIHHKIKVVIVKVEYVKHKFYFLILTWIIIVTYLY